MKKSKAKNMIACLIIVCSLTLFFLPVIVATVQFRNLQFILFNGYNSEQIETSMGTLGITAEVEAYRDLVTEYAIKYEIEDYVDLLLAVIMQESGGIGNDIFQASESLGLSPNTLSVEESIDQGVKVMAARLDAAKVESITDMNKIRLALQGYNFGGGYIRYAINRDGQWTQDNTNDFAKEQSKGKKRTGNKAQSLGVWAYGDQYYTFHVLRYYSASFTAEGNSGVVDVAERCLNYPYVYGATGPDKFDCSGLVYYCYKLSGKYTGARLTAAGYKNVAAPITQEDAVPGDLVFFTRKNGVTHHVGIYVGNGLMIHAPKPGDCVKYGTIERSNETVSFGRLSNTIQK